MLVNEIRVYLNTILNKENSGNGLSPDELNLLFKSHIYPFVKDRILQYRQYLGSGNMPDNTVLTSFLIEALETSASIAIGSGYIALPGDFLMATSLSNPSTNFKNIEIVSVDEFKRRWHNLLSKPMDYYPVAYIQGSNCYIRPYTSSISYTLDYIKKPTIPIFDYYIDANDNIVSLAASATRVLTTGEVGSAGQTSGTTVTSLTAELNIPDELHLPFADYLLSKVMMRDKDETGYQMNQNEIANQV